MPQVRSPRAIRAAWLLPVAAVCLLAGCEDMFSPSSTSRNYDELINRMLGAIKNRSPVDAAANLFNVTSPDERRDAIAYLETKKWGHEPPYMRAYEILTTDPHPMVRAQAMRALGTSYQAPSGTYLAKGMSDEDVQVRRDAACGLISTWNEEALKSLILHTHPRRDALATPPDGEDDEQVRIFAVQALCHSHAPDAFRALIDALNDRDVAVVRYAHSSLVAATGQDFSYDNKAWLTWYQQTYVNAPASAPAGQP